MLTTLLLCALALADTKTIAVQIALDRRGYSSNTIDGQWGRKSQSALEKFCADRGERAPATPEEAYDRYFADEPCLFAEDAVTVEEIGALVKIPKDPAERAALSHFGYESIQEMYAERGHVSVRTLARLNPGVDFSSVAAGTKILLPDVPAMATDLATVKPVRAGAPGLNEATIIRVSLSKFEVTAYNSKGRLIGLFPCSIARDKAKIPQGELKVTALIPRPNYTYTPDFVPKGQKVSRQIYPPGPNNPVGVAWIGLSLPGFGIHGTPTPETIGRAESHGCFRLSNWNAARLYAIARIGTRVVIDP